MWQCTFILMLIVSYWCYIWVGVGGGVSACMCISVPYTSPSKDTNNTWFAFAEKESQILFCTALSCFQDMFFKNYNDVTYGYKGNILNFQNKDNMKWWCKTKWLWVLAFHHKYWPTKTNSWKWNPQTLVFCHKHLEMWYPNTGLLQIFGNVVPKHWYPVTNIWKCDTQTLASCQKHLEIVGHRITVLARRLLLKRSRRFFEGRT